jgi:hypothetical protein
MADLKFDVDYSDLSRSLDVLIKMGKASTDVEKAFTQSFRQIKRWQEIFKGQQGKINSQLELTNQKLNLANKSAKNSAQAFIAHEKAIEGNTNALNRFRTSYDSTYAVEQRTLQLKKLLRREIENNKMTLREAGAELLKYRKSLLSMGQAQMAATKSTNRMGVVTQQAGYQVSDFIVQVQSGTNPFVAFSQQASQLAGVLPLMADQLKMSATRLIALSSGLGIAIPVIGMAGAALLNMKDKAKEATDQVDLLNKIHTTLKNTLVDVQTPLDELIEKYGNYADAIQATNIAKLQDQLTKAQVAFKDANKDMKDFVSDTLRSTKRLNSSATDLNKLGQAFGIAAGGPRGQRYTPEQFTGLTELKLRLDELSKAEGPKEQLKALEGVRDVIVKLGGDITNFPELDVTSFSDISTEVINLQTEINKARGELNGMSTDSQNLLERLKRNTISVEDLLPPIPKEVLDSISDASDLYNDLQALMFDALKSAESVIEELKRKKFEFNLEVDILAENAIFDLDAALEEMRKRDFNFGVELDILTQQAIDDLDAALEEMRQQDLTLDIELRILTEQAIADLQAVLDAQEQAQFLQGQDILSLGETAIADLAKALEEQARKQKEEAEKAAAKAAREPINVLRKQLELEEHLVGASEARKRVVQALGLQYAKDNPEIINGLIKQVENIDNVTDAIEREKQKQKELADTIGSSMEDSFMSIVDGTKSVKDAFRDMARDIVAHLYKVLVVQQMIRGIGGAIGGPIGDALSTYGQANGGVWSNGSPVTAYANGGIVGSPTYFPMAGGRTGLMGEAGPEAIMPLKRGKNGKLGVQSEGGGEITIHQNFNFAANGDESVKKIIAQQAPKIAQMTQQQIMDSRRRGGQMKAVFG